MKKILIVLIVIVLFFVFSAQNNNNPKSAISAVYKNLDNINRGALVYKVYLFGCLPVGKAVFPPPKKVQLEGKEVYLLSAQAESFGIFSKLFRAEASIESYCDILNANPFLFKQRFSISGKKETEKEVSYDQKKGIMTISGTQRQILPDTKEPLSLIYALRKMDFDKVKVLEFNINTNQKNYLFKGIAEEKNLSFRGKNLKMIFVKADIGRREKSPYHKSKISFVLLKERENLPVLIRVLASGMSITVKLEAVNG
jgi:hypothetical protein